MTANDRVPDDDDDDKTDDDEEVDGGLNLMDNIPFQSTESSPSATHVNSVHASSSTTAADKQPLRASSRIRAAKEKERESLTAGHAPVSGPYFALRVVGVVTPRLRQRSMRC